MTEDGWQGDRQMAEVSKKRDSCHTKVKQR
jgi:hypothetical protein